jgi:hypothetical protein
MAGVNLGYKTGSSQVAPEVNASLADIQLNRLIAGMASYGVQPAGETLAGIGQVTQESFLAVAAH